MRAGLVSTNKKTVCQCDKTEKTNERSVMLESCRTELEFESVKIRDCNNNN